ncbi:WD40/YVTN/BNR-like repeat-containing protein [Haloferax sp. YSMS24]|uniref:WD40/YVTN/BNR-like repeat-containing protein n=1 Tax=Haloferax sp. YSMS24 TaxID=3388425 RepID=UPI00398CAC68
MRARSFISTTGTGIARVTEGEPSNTEHLQGHSVSSLATGAAKTGLVLAGTEDSGIFLSSDGGVTWTQSGLADETVMAVAVAPSDPRRFYAGVRPSGVFRSDDGGETWGESESFRQIRGRRMWRSPASPPFTAYVQALAVSPDDPDLVVAGIEFGAVVRSADGGETWSNHRPKAIRDCHSLVWHATEGEFVYEGGAGIGKRPGARSTDGGESWRKPGGGLDRGYGWSVAAHPTKPTIWYVSASTGPFAAHGGDDAKAAVFRRTGERNWVRLDGLPGTSMPYALLTDPAMPDHLWAGLADGSIWHSPNRGDDWDHLDERLPAVERAMVMVPPA